MTNLPLSDAMSRFGVMDGVRAAHPGMGLAGPAATVREGALRAKGCSVLDGKASDGK